MAENEETQTTNGANEPNQGELVLAELQNISRLLGVINQNINTQLEPMRIDIERCKVNLSKIRKFGPPDSPSSIPAAPTRYQPPGQE